jgi:isocitrate dehydrogenase (NAD+)
VAGITGGVGLSAGASIGRNNLLFSQGCRHAGHDIAGQNVVNPSAILVSSAMMLRHLGLPNFADNISQALHKTITTGKVRTRDMGGNARTDEFTFEVIKNLRK